MKIYYICHLVLIINLLDLGHVFPISFQVMLRLLPKNNLAHVIKLIVSRKQYLSNTVIIQ